MAQQTAVEWLFEIIMAKIPTQGVRQGSDIGSAHWIYLAYEQAKEMEKQQILAAFEEGADDGYYGEGSSNKEKYYTQTYKS
jgi:hypothetical protein